MIYRIDEIPFAFPTVQIILFFIVAIIAGILAAILPARRASRLDVLHALQYEYCNVWTSRGCEPGSRRPMPGWLAPRAMTCRCLAPGGTSRASTGFLRALRDVLKVPGTWNVIRSGHVAAVHADLSGASSQRGGSCDAWGGGGE